MKQFIKGTLMTLVEDDDRRIPDYLQNGWIQTKLDGKPKDDADRRIDKAVRDANDSESIGKHNGKRSTAPNKKVNAAVEASAIAESECEAVDDGLIKTEGENNG